MAPERGNPVPTSSSAPPAPPRILNVQKFAKSRAPELESLHAIVSNRLGHDFRIQRSKRRRTTGHKVTRNRRVKQRKVGDGDGGVQEGTSAEDDRKNVSRRTRRRFEFQKNPASGFCTTGDGTRRLRTHLWHAKRFAMVKQWGFYLPLGLHGRGRGSRANLKWLKYGALVHDASYSLPIQLEGPEDSILAILRMVLLPSPLGPTDVSEKLSQMVTHGVCYENAMLYHVENPLSHFIAPVIYMWRPFLSDDNRNSVQQDDVSNGCCKSGKNGSGTSPRQLWIWIHAAAFNEGFNTLRFACQKQMHESGKSVSCFTLEGHIARLEIIGSEAIQVLQKTLHPITESCSTSDHSSTDFQLQKACILNLAEHLPLHAILSLTVHDPRDFPSKVEPASEAHTKLESDLQEEDIKNSSLWVSRQSSKNEDKLLSLWSEPENSGIFLSDSKSLWDASDKMSPPIPEHVLCTEKHYTRLKFFHFDPTNCRMPATEAKDGFSRSCSVLLLKHAKQGWSIILPLSWIKPFWMSLILHGAHAMGLRERRWIACNNGLPSFPFDFPDCKAYMLFMANEASAFDRAAELRPLAVRPVKVPVPPPWDCIMSTVKNGPYILKGFQTPDVQGSGGAAPECSLVNLASQNVETLDQATASFQGFIPRAPKILKEYLEKICDGQFPLFPSMAMVEKDFSDLTDRNAFNWVTRSDHQMLADKELCLVRILLHAYKEGVFEEGAVVCAPILTDLSQWTSRSEEQEQPTVTQSFVRSCFTQQDSGKWKLQVPEDPSAQQSFRWPIGFVTSGFVYGSGKPVAIAFCEAKLLAMLRAQQWNQTQETRPEIFVWVRNMRSTAYRRAVATILLEQQKEDLEFL
ncbi:ribonucleases P/MRP protein subunit POP1 [Elaeis guineensis]|uniref:ribonucleases P/MRP protein subunit POP1 n=1 Tax=Elaeis guineensis var. tenera TaxID=51953 RepID=UPI003C6D58DC